MSRCVVAEDGELEVKGPNIFKEYWRNPEETKATFTPDGFYRTGDIGEINEEGRVTITDRKKELIITSGGKNIASAPIVNLLSSGRYIEMAYVHGDRRNYLTALLVLDQNAVQAMAEHKGIKDTFPGRNWLSIPWSSKEFKKRWTWRTNSFPDICRSSITAYSRRLSPSKAVK